MIGLIQFINFVVSKTTKELILAWDNSKIHEDPVSVARDLRLPQFEMQKITTNRCHETNHMGKNPNSKHSNLVMNLSLNRRKKDC